MSEKEKMTKRVFSYQLLNIYYFVFYFVRVVCYKLVYLTFIKGENKYGTLQKECCIG